MTTNPVRTGEIVIQDNFQRNLEDGLVIGGQNQKVMLWGHAHDNIRLDPILKKNRPLVVMGSLANTSDKSFGLSRKINVGIVGLVSAIEEINHASFQKWLNDHPQVNLSVGDLSKIAANHLANLFEDGRHGERTHTWRMMLALGEKHAWDARAKFFGIKGDPRVLLIKDIPGASGDFAPLYYRPLYTNQESPKAFLDLEPSWLQEVMGEMKGEVGLEAFHRASATLQTNTPSNHHAWVREFPIGEGQREYADFALLINGLPIVLVEIKTPDAGIKKAVRDFQQKPTYQGSPLCVACDGRQVIMASSMTGNLEAWVHYAGNIGDPQAPDHSDDPLNSRHYVVQQILSRPDRMEFFLRHCGSINENGVYQVGRSQQYQALSRWGQDLAWSQVCNDLFKASGKPPIKVGNRLIRQTQRTGKTHTMIRALHLAVGSYPDLMRLAVVMVGEVLILGQIHDDLENKDLGLCDKDLVIQRVESRAQFDHIMERERTQMGRSEGRILLANMQKISARDTQTIALPDSHKTLVVVDEGHLAQTGTTADVRDCIFPDASHLLLTATPKDGMAQRYGITENYHILDDFGYGLAQKAGMVCSVVYKRHPYSFADDPHRIADLVKALRQSMGSDIKESDIASALGQVMVGDLDDQDEENDRNSSRARSLASAIRRHLEDGFIYERLDAIVNELVSYRDSLEKDEKGNPIFRPRALAFGRDTASALSIIRAIWEKNGPNCPPKLRNVYRGFRFAVDVSDFGKDPSGEVRTFGYFNPGVATEGDLKARMKNMDPDVAIDVLIAVGKYTKGYNYDQLAATVLLRNVGEPSLMNQIYTRPATMREGKPKGVCLDLAFGQGNVACWNESLRLYDREFDLAQLYTQEKVEDLVSRVGESLGKTASTLGLSATNLSDYTQVVGAFEDMGEDQRKIVGRQFILEARATAELISKMPDSSIYGDLRAPLVGLKLALTRLQSLYPDLVESSDLSSDGTLNAGNNERSLGDIIRNALAILGQSSLKALLDIRMGEVFEIAPAQRDDAIQKARERQAIRAAQTALQSITGSSTATARPDKTADNTKPTRAMRSGTVLMFSLNRVLDKLRDDSEHAARDPSLYQDMLLDAGEAMEAWATHVAGNGGDLKNLLLRHLDEILAQRSALLGVDIETMGTSGELDVILDEAARDMSQSFDGWHKCLSADWTEQPAKRLAYAWKGQYPKNNLTDFLGAASQRADTHGMQPSEWIGSLLAKCPGPQLKTLLSDGKDDERIQDMPALVDHAMYLALEDRAAIRSARQWSESLAADQGVLVC